MFWIMGADALGGIAAAMTNGQTGWTRHVAEHLEHVPWAGFHFYDLIFPLFLFIAGVSLVYSLGRAVEEKGRGEAMVRLLQRAEAPQPRPAALPVVLSPDPADALSA
jgi:predicted acyltransferase